MEEKDRILCFTDIEGSSRLWESVGPGFVEHIRNHDEIVRRTLQESGGCVVKPIGDGFFISFERGREAIGWAVRFLQELREYRGRAPGNPELRVRVVFHSGPVETVADPTLPLGVDYFGATVNRAARLSKVGYGGQVLVSEAVAALLSEQDLRALGIELIDLGQVRLKDLSAPEHVFQVHHPSFPTRMFPPLKTLDVRSNNLPSQVTSFFGREREFRELCARIREGGHRLVTLTGFGGVGKSRLAIQVGAELLPHFRDGVYVAYLDRIRGPREIATALAEAISFSFYSRENAEDQILRFLEDKSILLILDNFEHLLEDDGTEFVVRILEQCPKVRLIVTSRERLNLLGELEYPLDVMEVPAGTEALEVFLNYPSVQIFVDRASLAAPGFRVSAEARQPLARILRAVEGIPIAIELAAGRVRHSTLEEIAESLEESLEMLTATYRNLPPRQRSLEATLQWSLNLLGDAERRFLVSLSVFRGGFSAAAAVAMNPWLSGSDGQAILRSLVDRSLVRHQITDGTGRYSLLEPVRKFCERLAKQDVSLADLGERHSRWFGEFASKESARLHTQEQMRALSTMVTEWPNIQKAFEYAVASGQWSRVTALARALRDVLDMRGLWSDAVYLYRGARERIQVVVEAGSGGGDGEGEMREALCAVSLSLARFLLRLGEVAEGVERIEEGVRLANECGNDSERAFAMRILGSVAMMRGQMAEARARFEESLRMARAAGDFYAEVSSLNNLGVIYTQAGETGAAKETLEAALAIAESAGDRYVVATTLSNLGNLHQGLGETKAARERHEASIEVRKELGDRQGIASSLNNLGLLASEEGNLETARRLFLESLDIFKDLGDRNGAVGALVNLGEVVWRLGQTDGASAHFAEAEKLCRKMGNPESLADILNSRGVMEVFAGRWEGARSCLTEALRISREIGYENRIAETLVGVGLWLEARGREEAARDLIAAAVASGEIEDVLEREWAERALERLAASGLEGAPAASGAGSLRERAELAERALKETN
jgi:predicted ATPase/class 3 adenylate cyclase/Tfp pilus assembly protein PilF